MIIDKISMAVDLSNHIIRTGDTLRATGLKYNLSKTTVHTLVTNTIKDVDVELFEKVQEILELHKKEAPYRGGEATKRKYEEIKKK